MKSALGKILEDFRLAEAITGSFDTSTPSVKKLTIVRTSEHRLKDDIAAFRKIIH